MFDTLIEDAVGDAGKLDHSPMNSHFQSTLQIKPLASLKCTYTEKKGRKCNATS